MKRKNTEEMKYNDDYADEDLDEDRSYYEDEDDDELDLSGTPDIDIVGDD